MDSRNYAIAMRLIEFVEKLCLNSKNDSTEVEPVKPKEAATKPESQFVDQAFEDMLAGAVGRVIGSVEPIADVTIPLDEPEEALP